MIEIPGYQMLREIGRGGMSTVYLAVQQSLGREVAIKLMSPDLARDPQQVERFLREGSIVAKLEHRHIVAVHDIGTVDGRPYLAMEFVPGGRLPLEPGIGLPPSQALAIARDIALALDHAHAHGVIHRDIKPDNILQRRDGTCALSDFGIARSLDGAAPMTQEGVTVGTPHYMSPEQLQGGQVDGRSDLYSLGIVLHQLLTGRPPYQGTDGWAIGLQHINAPLPKLPDPLRRYQPLIDALMAKQPNQRPATGAAAVQLLARAIGDLTPTQMPTSALPLIAPRSYKSRMVAFAAVAVVVAAIALGSSIWNARSRSTPTVARAATPAADVAPSTTRSDERSIAVLPLLNIGGDSANEYFSDGMAETLLDMLASIPDLKVIARTSSFAFKGQNRDVREIGRALGVAYLLEGSVQQADEQVRITVQLVQVSDGTHAWSQRYDRKLADVFKVQDEIATEVAKAIQGALPAAEQAQLLVHRTDNLAAYQELLLGNSLLLKRKLDELRRARSHFERAIELDPGYARAYVGAAIAILLIETHGELEAEDRVIGRRYSERALELDPQLGEAHIARAEQLNQLNRYADADREYRLGIELAPSFATGLQWYAEFLMFTMGDLEQSRRVIERAITVDPLAPIIQHSYGQTLLAARRPEEAARVATKLRIEHPDVPYSHDLEAAVRDYYRDLPGTLRAIDARIAADPTSSRALATRCNVLNDYNARAEALACVAAMKRQTGQTARLILAEAWIALDHFDGAALAALGGADALVTQSESDPWGQGVILARLGRHREALEKFRAQIPEMFREPLAEPRIAWPTTLVEVAPSLIALGDTERARQLLRYGLKRFAGRVHGGDVGLAWSEVVAHTLLGETAAACKAMDRAIGANYFLRLGNLEADPLLAPLRAQPCFAPLLAEARRRSDAQIAAARAAQLLD